MRQTSVNYARVLAELSVLADDLRNAAAMLKGTPALKQMLENPLIPREQKGEGNRPGISGVRQKFSEGGLPP